jgi:DNA-binding transcriptional MocR family regulator
MTIWAPALQGRSGPRYLAIAEALADDVAGGRLRPGARLPTQRDLADRLGVTVGTVGRAYAEAAQRGLLSGEVGRGTFVRATGSEHGLPASRPAHGLVDLSVNHPPLTKPEQKGALLAKALQSLSRRADLSRLLGYPPDGGAPEHRAAGAAWIAGAGLEATPDNVLVSSGSQHGMAAVFAALLRPGDLVLTEALTYTGMKALAGLLHLRLQGLPLDDQGLRPDAFQAACRAGAVKALYCVPTLQNPTTAVLPESRRKEIATIARAHGVTIVEDDVHGRLHADPPAPIASFAPDITCYLTGTAKSVAPGLRIGFMLAPKELVPRIAAGIRATTWMAAPLMAEIASLWIKDGTAEQIVKAKRQEAAARQRLAAAVLGRFDVQSHPGAYHVWLQLPEPWRSETFAEEAIRRGVAVTPAQAFLVGRIATPHAVRVCLGTPADRDRLEGALRILAGILEESPQAGPAVV